MTVILIHGIARPDILDSVCSNNRRAVDNVLAQQRTKREVWSGVLPEDGRKTRNVGNGAENASEDARTESL